MITTGKSGYHLSGIKLIQCYWPYSSCWILHPQDLLILQPEFYTSWSFHPFLSLPHRPAFCWLPICSLYLWVWVLFYLVFLIFILLKIFLKFIYFCFLGLQLQHMGVPRLGVESELQLLTYNHSSWQCRILNTQGRLEMDPVFSWMLVGFVNAEPRWELPVLFF